MQRIMGKLTKVLKVIGRFVNRTVKDLDMADDRTGGGTAARQGEEDMPPNLARRYWESQDLDV